MNDRRLPQAIHDLWLDLQQPDLVWQLAALVLALTIAFVCARWWRRRESEHARLHAAGNRLVFPLAALATVTLAAELLEGVTHTHWLGLATPLFASLALVRVSVYILRQSFPAALWLQASERWVAATVWGALALHITGLLPLVIRALERWSITLGKHEFSLWVIAKGGLTVVATLVLALWLAGRIEARLMRIDGLDSSLRMVSVRLAKALLTVLALMASLSLVGIDITALSVFTGALGVGLGLGLQKIASNYVSGFIILLDRSIRLGNVIQVMPEAAGTVTEITTRYTVLRNLGGVEFIVPNETLIASVVHNQSYSDSRVSLNVTIGVSYATPDLEAAMQLMVEAARSHPRVLAEPPPSALLASFGDSAINLQLYFWIADPESGTGGVRSDVSLAIWKAFQAAGIDVPVPQREVRVLNPVPVATLASGLGRDAAG